MRSTCKLINIYLLKNSAGNISAAYRAIIAQWQHVSRIGWREVKTTNWLTMGLKNINSIFFRLMSLEKSWGQRERQKLVKSSNISYIIMSLNYLRLYYI